MSELQHQTVGEQIDHLHTQAVFHHKEGNLEKAIDLYLQSIELDEKQPDWIYGNAIILLAQTGKVTKGLELKTKAETIHSDSDNICVSIAIALDVAQKITNSIEYYQKAINLNQYQPEWVYVKTITNLISLNKISEAKKLAILAQKVHPESSKITSTINSIGIIKNKKIEPENMPAQNSGNINTDNYKSQGIELLNQRKFSEAKSAFEKALEFNPDDIDIYSYLTKISIQLKDVIYAELMMHKMLEIEKKQDHDNNTSVEPSFREKPNFQEPNPKPVAKVTIEAKFEDQDYIGVLEAIKIAETNQETIPLQDIRLAGDAAFRTKAYGKAAHYYSKYLKNQECSWCRHHLGQCLVKLGNPTDATSQFVEELRIFPDSFWSYHQIREIQYKSGHFDLARAIVKNYYNQSPQNIEEIVNGKYLNYTSDNYKDLKILPPFLGEMGFEIRHFLGSVENWLNKGWKILAKRPNFYPPGTAICDEAFFKELKEITKKYAPYGVISLGFGLYIPPQNPVKMGGHLDSDLAPIHTLTADTQALTIAKNLERELRALFAPFLLGNKERPLTIWDQKLLSCTNSVNINNEWTSFDRYVRYSIPASYKPYHFENPTYQVGEHIGVQLRNIVQQKYEPVQRNSDVKQALQYCQELSEYYNLPIIVYGHPNGTYQPDGYEKTSDNIPVSKLLEKELGYLRSCKLMLAPNSGWCDLMAWLQVPTLIENNVTFDYFALLEDFSPTIGLINTSLPITKQADNLLQNNSGSKINLPAHIASAKDISYSDKLEFIVYG